MIFIFNMFTDLEQLAHRAGGQSDVLERVRGLRDHEGARCRLHFG